MGPDATILADAGHYTGIALARIDLDQPRIAHEFTRRGEYVGKVDMLRSRRPETYGPLTRPGPKLEPVRGSNLANPNEPTPGKRF